MKSSYLAKIASITGLALGAFALSVFAGAWIAPSATPPNGNVDAPINVGPDLQNKLGWLGVKGLVTTDFTLATGTPAAGKVLTAIDSLGNARWMTPSSNGDQELDFSLAGQQQSYSVSGSTKTSVTVQNAGNARAAIINFYRPDSVCGDLTLDVYKADGTTMVGRLGGRGTDSDIFYGGSTTIVPLTSGQFKVANSPGRTGTCNNLNMVIVGLIN